MCFCGAKVWGSHCARPSFQKKAGPQGACNKMYKSLESTCLHYPESSRPWFPGQTPPSALLRRWLLLFDLWLQLSKRYSGQPAWLRASPKSTRNVASPGGDCDVLGACPGALRWAEVSRVVLSRGSQCCCGLQKCFPIDADWGITPFTSPLHLTSISNYSFSYNSFSFISKSDVDFLGMYFHRASRDVDQTLNYSFHS